MWGNFVIINKIFPIILCGGSGVRLSPISAESYPKQFIKFKNNLSLLQRTILRFGKIQKFNKPIIVTNLIYKDIVYKQLNEINVEYENLILEPNSRNTTVAINLAGLYIQKKYDGIKDNTMMLILPIDHYLSSINKLISVFLRSKNRLLNKPRNMILFGIKARYDEINYGYIKCKKNTKNNIKLKIKNKKCNIQKINNFIEKPQKTKIIKIKKYIINNECFWNSGLYIMKVSTILDQIKKYSHEVYKICDKIIMETTAVSSGININNKNNIDNYTDNYVNNYTIDNIDQDSYALSDSASNNYIPSDVSDSVLTDTIIDSTINVVKKNTHINTSTFQNIKNKISIEKSITIKSYNLSMYNIDIKWDDIGSWRSIYKVCNAM